MYQAAVIVEAMKQQGKTNESVAHEAGLSHATVSAIRNGEPNAKLSTLRKVAAALDLTLEVRLTPNMKRET